MPTIQYEGSAHEIHLSSLVDVANTSSWKHALNLLMINGTVLVATENFKTPCLISQVGTIDSIQKSMELLEAKGEASFMPLLIELLRKFKPEMFTGSEKFKASKNESNTESAVSAKAKIFTDVLSTFEKTGNDLAGIFVEGAFKIGDFIAVMLITNLVEIRKNQLTSGISDQDYELMINYLLKLGLIEPKFQASLCSECLNYELTISQYPSTRKMCPKCGNSVVVTALYLFKEPLSKIKSRNEDLPLFISAFLKKELSLQAFLTGEIGIYPLVQIVLDDKRSKVEVDVHIPELKMGIECKLFETPVAPMTASRVNSIADKFFVQMQRYVKVGIKDITIVTNLPKEKLEKINKTLKIKLECSPLPINNYALVSGNIDEFIDFLKSTTKYIINAVKEKPRKIFNSRPLELGSQHTDKKYEIKNRKD